MFSQSYSSINSVVLGEAINFVWGGGYVCVNSCHLLCFISVTRHTSGFKIRFTDILININQLYKKTYIKHIRNGKSSLERKSLNISIDSRCGKVIMGEILIKYSITKSRNRIHISYSFISICPRLSCNKHTQRCFSAKSNL